MTTFLDTNVLIYLLDEDSVRHEWAKEEFVKRKEIGPLIISDIVYSEFSAALESVVKTDKAINSLSIERISFSNNALFAAAKAFVVYKSRNGPKTNVLPDFLIGAQAETEQAPLLTGDPKGYRSYFPNVSLITPGE